MSHFSLVLHIVAPKLKQSVNIPGLKSRTDHEYVTLFCPTPGTKVMLWLV